MIPTLLIAVLLGTGALPAAGQQARLTDDCPGGATLEDLLRAFAYRSSGRDSAWDALMDTGRVRLIPSETAGRIIRIRSLSPLGVFAHVRPDEPIRGLSDFWTLRGCVEVSGDAVPIRFIGPYGFPERAGRFEVAGLKLYPDPSLGALGRYRKADGRSFDAYIYPADSDIEARGDLLERELRKAREGIASYYALKDTTMEAGEWGSVTTFAVSDSAGTIRGRRARIALRATSGPHVGETLRSFLYVVVRGQTVLKVRASYPDTVPAAYREAIDAAVRDLIRLAEQMESYEPPDIQISRRELFPGDQEWHAARLRGPACTESAPSEAERPAGMEANQHRFGMTPRRSVPLQPAGCDRIGVTAQRNLLSQRRYTDLTRHSMTTTYKKMAGEGIEPSAYGL